MKAISTERLVLRPIDLKDAPDLFAIRSLPEVHKHIFSGPWESVEKAQEWIQNIKDGPRSFMYTIRPKRQLDEDHDGGEMIVGVIGLNRWDQVHFMYDPKVASRGYATEALTAFLVALFELQPKRLSIGTLVGSDNAASINVLEKCGFVPDVPQTLRYEPQSAEISEEEELNALQGIGYVPTGDSYSLFFIYPKPGLAE
ncbi:acyl-CoA N-acyltransferase [Microthyrium microscopicum]|uniref:Acyl-CoA N-acyltransferase n=1 Tax=Microthyrium microscopicum TaxID=703497 RepID=A0A6A6UI67_9PEZI|nr:acyl-CoA N-acyltransferase [Microthyrium microscopicum]